MKTYQLENAKVLVEFLDLGGCITKIIKKQNNTNYVLSYKDYSNYKRNPYFLGGTIGRLAGRTYPPRYYNYRSEEVRLSVNEGSVHLHGGDDGFHLKNWQVDKTGTLEYTLSYFDNSSAHDAMDFQLVYKLEGNVFTITYKGTAAQPTVCNLTNHSYFNLNYDKSTSIEKHLLEVKSSKIQLIDKKSIPTGEYDNLLTDEAANFDFKKVKKINLALYLETELSTFCSKGIDLAYIFDDKNVKLPQIHLISDNRENELKIYSNQESCVIYTLNKISFPSIINDGNRIKKYGGITFEMQQRPNFINEEAEYLRNVYHSITSYEIL